MNTKFLLKITIYSLIGVLFLAGGYLFLTRGSPITLGQIESEGTMTYISSDTGTIDRVLTTGGAVLHAIIFGDGADVVLVGDTLLTASDNAVLKIAADVAGTVPVEGHFNKGIVVRLTTTNGATFIWSNR